MRQSEQEVERAQHELKRAEANYTVAHLTSTRLERVMKTRPELHRAARRGRRTREGPGG